MLTMRGNDISHLITVLQIGGRGPASQEVTRKNIQGRAGSLLQSTRTPERTLTVRFLLVGSDMEELRTNIDELNELLYPDDLTDDEKVKGYSLVFVDEPNMTYYGLPTGEPDWSEIVDKGIGEVSFVCPDPYKYGVEQSQTLTAGDNIIHNGGGKETYPIVTATFTQPSTFFALYSKDKYMMLGAPVSVDETPLEKEERVLNNGAETTVGLANGTSVDGGQVAGTMYSTGSVFKCDDYGTGTGWHGPAKKQSVPTPIQDFRVDAYVTLDSSLPNQVGRVEIYLLDEFNNVIGKAAMKDGNSQVRSNQGEMRAGGLTGHYIQSEKRRTWTPFRHGILSIERIGNRFKTYIAQRDEDNTNKHYARQTTFFHDVEGDYDQKLAQVQIHLGAHGSHPTPNMAIHAFHVYKINSNTQTQIPYIVEAGDVVTIDHTKNEIRKNGEDFKWAKDFGSSLFPLNKGDNTLGMYPDNVATVEMKWRERWL